MTVREALKYVPEDTNVDIIYENASGSDIIIEHISSQWVPYVEQEKMISKHLLNTEVKRAYKMFNKYTMYFDV